MAPKALLQEEGEMVADVGEAVRLGRPDERKDRVLHARFSTSDIAAIEQAAEATGFTVSAFMRSLTLEGAGVRPFLTDDDRAVFEMLILDMRSVGVTLNQLARTVNSGGRLVGGELTKELGETQRLLAAIVLEIRGFAERGGRRRRGAA